MKKNIRKRVIFVNTFIILFLIFSYVNLRGSYLQTIAIDKQNVEIYKTNLKMNVLIFAITFAIIYLITYITNRLIKKGLKNFFVEEKKEMPKLPNKSIALAFATIGAVIAINTFYEKILLCFSNVWFGQNDPIFNLDISYYMFIIPFIKSVIIYLILLFVILTIYIVIYYVLAFNKFFNKGISFATLMKSTFIKQLTANLIIVISLVSLLIIAGIPDMLNEGFMTLQDKTVLYGAGLIEISIKGIGYLIFAIFIIVCIVSAIRKLKENNYKKAVLKMMYIPMYLILLFLVVISTEKLYLRRNEFDKEKQYITYNMENTKIAYNIDIQEIEVENEGTISAEDVENNKDVINNINILDEKIVLDNLQEYYTNLGYYTFNRAAVGYYNNELVYVSPREIVSNNTRTYDNKTYQYTHGYDVLVASASETESSGLLTYKRNSFNKGEFINIKEPRIYFGLQTNEVIVTNSEDALEYDYPLTSTTNTYNTYKGQAGISLNFIDRLILGIKEHNLKLAFSSDTNKQSNIIINRNIIQRVKSVLPYIYYDENPYMIITDEGKLVWVLDGYTMSDKYPYSQKMTVSTGNQTIKRINYIRNSVKVFIDAYDGTMEFYITDRTDPIIMAYWNMYPSIFEDINKDIPEEYKEHIVYPQYLYNIQAKQLARYHNIGPEILYRADDVWSIAKESSKNSNKNVSTKEIQAYYTLLRTPNSDKSELGLVLPYTITDKQNIVGYLVGTDKLTIYRFTGDIPTLGTTQLERLIDEDEKISAELATLNVAGTKLEKKLFVVPIENKLLYVETIYQVLINENQVPILKKVIVSAGNKLAIGDDLKTAIKKLISQEAVDIEIEEEDIEYLINEIIEANKNLKESNESNDWTMIGNDIKKLQELINKLEEAKLKEEKDEEELIENILNK